MGTRTSGRTGRRVPSSLIMARTPRSSCGGRPGANGASRRSRALGTQALTVVPLSLPGRWLRADYERESSPPQLPRSSRFQPDAVSYQRPPLVCPLYDYYLYVLLSRYTHSWNNLVSCNVG